MIIDGHAHIIEYFTGSVGKGEARAVGKGKIRFLDGSEMTIVPEGLGATGFSVETLIKEMDRNGIGKAVLLQGLLYGLQNDYYYESAAKYPDRLKAAGSFDPYIQEAEKVLDLLTERYGFGILKFEISTAFGMTGVHPQFNIDGEELDRVYSKAREKGITIVFDIGSRGMSSFQVDELVRAAKRWPDVKFVLCHLLAYDGAGKEAHRLWKEDMEKLAGVENIWFDIAAIPWNTKEEYPYPAAGSMLAQTRDLAGAERIIWGSDVPIVLSRASYKQLYEYVSAGNYFSGDELEWMTCRAAQTAYDI